MDERRGVALEAGKIRVGHRSSKGTNVTDEECRLPKEEARRTWVTKKGGWVRKAADIAMFIRDKDETRSTSPWNRKELSERVWKKK